MAIEDFLINHGFNKTDFDNIDEVFFNSPLIKCRMLPKKGVIQFAYYDGFERWSNSVDAEFELFDESGVKEYIQDIVGL
jgi:hypothetical protein